ncbi:hypothetical protein ACVGVM_23325 [Pseudonocardia bannensis]|uniref:Uncharacterized protein n=1 Tax=Pseudonocardia bannensis TaxID=630973 RepID=A0A848DTC5_9PSEU|nr:hypothetical protein [Pseudonocardia bannensis]NMH95454.1 hypothetical protein [Pseudonocardia bannensis]
MSAVDDLTELVERVGAAERAALASKWKERPDVEALRRKVQRAVDEQRDLERRSTTAAALTGRRARLREAFLSGDLDDPGRPADGVPSAPEQVSHAAAARAEADAVAAVTMARLALQEAHLAVLDARLARIDAGEAEPEAAAADGHVPLQGRNAVSRHGPALARGLRGEIEYILTRRPRTVVKSLAISLAMGLLYLGFLRVFAWDRNQKWLPYLGLWVISVVMGGAVCLNAMSFDAMRVRAALDGGARLWHLLVIKNLALASLVAPVGFLLSGLLAWRAGDLAAFFKACALLICFIVLWLGVGNVLSVLLPIRDEPIWNRKQSGTLKQFIIAFTVSYLIGYLVNLMLIWRVFAAREMASRLGEVVVPAIFVVLSSVTMWFLLTIFAVALSQQPKIRRALWREIADYNSNAEARAFAEQAARAQAQPATPGSAGATGRADDRSASRG